MITLIIARHGNTFESGDPPRRVGAKTDIPLVEKGKEQAAALGRYLQEHKLLPDMAYSSTLRRTMETATLALSTAGIDRPVSPLSIFDEIDYGPDENKTEEDVIARIGREALEDWDKKATVPDGWLADPERIRGAWQDFAAKLITKEKEAHEKTILVVTSNGTARFAPHIAGNYEDFCKKHKIKLATGALGILRYDDEKWRIENWNIRP